MKATQRPISLRHAELSAGIAVMPSDWQFVPLQQGTHGWRSKDGTTSVVTSIRDYGLVGLWWCVSVSRTDHAKPSRKQVERARRSFCANDVAITEESHANSGVVYLWQRIKRGAWLNHPAHADIEAKRKQHSLPDLSQPADTTEAPACPGCRSQGQWEKGDGINASDQLIPLLHCRACERSYSPSDLEKRNAN